MEVLEELLTLIGSSLCHQLDERSYHIDGFQMPLCARCLGIHLGFLAASVLLWLRRARVGASFPRVRSVALLVLAMLPAVADFALSYTGVSPSDNVRRTATGALLGVSLAFVLVPLMWSMMDGWKGPGRRLLDRPAEWVMFALALALALPALAVESSEALFYAVAVAGIVGVFVTMGTFVSVFVLALTERRSWSERTKLVVSAGLTAAVLVSLALLHAAVG
jgi:uncharacterized membrane protein